MRYLDILMFIFCINVSLYLMTELRIFDVFGEAHKVEAEVGWVDSYNETASSENLDWSNPDILDFMLTLGVTAWKGFIVLLQIFASVILLQPTLVRLGIPAVTASILSAPIYFVYLWGIVQFLINRSGKNVE